MPNSKDSSAKSLVSLAYTLITVLIGRAKKPTCTYMYSKMINQCLTVRTPLRKSLVPLAYILITVL